MNSRFKRGYTISGPAPTPTPLAKTLRYAEASEHLLRRLGSALVLHWDVLPDDLQDLLIDQAAQVEDREAAPHAIEDIEKFVRTVKSAAFTPIQQAPHSHSV
jgi:hypothetical protein